MPEGHRVSPFAKALWIKLYIRRAVPLFIGKSKKLKHFVGKRKSDEISADPSALPEGEAQGKRETVHSLQLQLPGLLEGLKMFPRPKPRPILPRLGCARFLIYVSSLYWSGLCAEALFFFIGGSKGGVLAPPNVRFCVVPELGFRWCLAVSHALPRSCVFGFSRLGCAMFFVYVLGLWGSFLLLRGFQRCRSGPAAGPVFCCAGARF